MKKVSHILKLLQSIVVVQVYTFKIVKQLDTQRCSLHQVFALKFVRQTISECDLCVIISNFYHKIEFYKDTYTQNAL